MRPRLCPTFSVTAPWLILSGVTVSGQKPKVSVRTAHAAQVVALAFTSDGYLYFDGSSKLSGGVGPLDLKHGLLTYALVEVRLKKRGG